MQGLVNISLCEGPGDLFQHVFEKASHLGELTYVLHVDAVPYNGGTFGKTYDQVADTFQVEHELHASQQLSRLIGSDLGYGSRPAADRARGQVRPISLRNFSPP